MSKKETKKEKIIKKWNQMGTNPVLRKKRPTLLHFRRRDCMHMFVYVSSMEEKFIFLYASFNCLLVSFPSAVLI